MEDALLATLGRWGYHEIILPTFEYLDVLSPGLQARAIEKGYQLTDRTTGRTLVLRPDATAQIARTVAMGMLGERLPLRLAYRTTVFRYEPEHLGRDRELLQVGAELVGLPDMEADTEIIALMIECLRRIGVKSFKISLGHAGFLQGLLRRTGMGPAARKEAEHAAARKDIPKLEELLAASPAERVTKELEIPTISVGAGPHCDGQLLVWSDWAGFTRGRIPKFVKQYARIGDTLLDAAKAFREDVESGVYPAPEHEYSE